MCMMCQDEKAYQAYMAYLDAKEKAGEMADPDKAMDEILEAAREGSSGRLESQSVGRRQDALHAFAVLLRARRR